MAGHRAQQTKRQVHWPRKTTCSRKSLLRTKLKTCGVVNWEQWVQTRSLSNKRPFNRRGKTCPRGTLRWRANANSMLLTSITWFPWGETRTHPRLKVFTGTPVKRPLATRLEP
jgi:hypothetical protein